MGCATTKIEQRASETLRSWGDAWRIRRRNVNALFALCLCLGCVIRAHAVEGEFSLAAQQAFHQAQDRCQKEPQNAEAAWQFGRACFDLAEFSTNNTERAQLAEIGIAASRKSVTQNSNSAAAHYYLAMDLGQLARTKSLGALKLVRQMEHEFGLARDLDSHFDFAGPDRNLGLLYCDAPSIGSIGSRSKAREHLLRAVELAPDYPENRLNLIEAYLKWGERSNAQRELKALEAILPDARAKLTGQAWASSWADWNPRLEKAKKKLEESAKTFESPHGKS
jgi:tetratricopeptide (TPR) repeat protein